MSFASALDSYCKSLDCTNREIAERCGITASAFSRYRNGSRTPEAGSKVVADLANVIAEMSRSDATRQPLTSEEVKAVLEIELVGPRIVGMSFNARLDALMRIAGIRNTQMAEATLLDPSYISRIRRGQRTPTDMRSFAERCSRLVARICLDNETITGLSKLIDAPHITAFASSDDDGESKIAENVAVWLTGNRIIDHDIEKLWRLLDWIDTTDLSPWLELGSSTQCKTRACASQLARFYYGLDGMRKAEKDFLGMAADTCSSEVSLSSDMPLLQTGPDSEFLEDYIHKIARVLELGGRVSVIHNVEQPLSEAIKLMHVWIPLYMTGRVTSHYLKGVNNWLFVHVNYVCDTCALASEAVIGHEEDGRYYFTSIPEEVAYYQRKMGYILEKCDSLLDIYRECDPGSREAFEHAEAIRRATGRGIPIGKGRFKNVSVVTYPAECTVISIPCGQTRVHFVMRHPKVNYAALHMQQ